MYLNKKIALIIPALNEEEAIPLLFKEIPAFVDGVFLCDNGSKDKTCQVAKDSYCPTSVKVLFEAKRGYGNACLRGLKEITDEDIIVFLDADGSDDPGNMEKLLNPIIYHQKDVVISNRFTSELEKGAMSLPQYFGNKLAVFLVRLFWGYGYFDLGPFRAITREAFQKLEMQTPDYAWTIELQIKALQKKLNIAQVDLPYRCRQQGKSKVSGTVRGVIGAARKIMGYVAGAKLREIFGR